MRLTRVLSCVKQVAESTKKASNLPESYIKRAMEQVEWKTPKGIQYRKTEIKRKRFLFTMNRPWSREFFEDNLPGSTSPIVYLEPIIDWPFFKGDRVEILDGDDKGKQGHINYMVEERNWVVVEGLNCKYKNVGEEKDFPGQLVKEEKPLLVHQEVMLVDPSDNKPTKVEWRYTEAGERVRVSLRTGRIIPIPKMAEETVDYKTKGTYMEQEKDTKEDEVTKITFEPSLKTFAMDIMDKMNIKENRVPHKTYWYYVSP
ncbi:UNVERIFIED_CONTAM: hypothetical protein GTU68_042870 [Idotea baltica]|nr:hypothetical protein [Idotea baltica]